MTRELREALLRAAQDRRRARREKKARRKLDA
jgi:hypothetical protein